MSVANLFDKAALRMIGWPATLLYGDPCILDRWRWIRHHLRPGPLRTLDAGCGSGVFTFYAATLGNEVVGLSFEKHNNEKARRRAEALALQNITFVDFDLRRLEETAEELGTFDQIICCEVIEHIIDDHKLLRNLAAMLRPGGRLVLTTPFKGHKALLGEELSDHEDGGHVRWGYSCDEVRMLLERCGLSTISEGRISGVVSQQLTNLGHLLDRVGTRYAALLALPLRVLQCLDRPLTLLTDYPFLCIGVVSTRPGVGHNDSEPTKLQNAV